MCIGLPARIMALIDPERGLGEVELDGGERRRVSLACVLDGEGPAALAGSWVLVHMGFALRRITEGQANELRALFAEIGGLSGEDPY